MISVLFCGVAGVRFSAVKKAVGSASFRLSRFPQMSAA
jgi:hypothetical protein